MSCLFFSAFLWFIYSPVVHADVVTSIRPLGFIAAAITDGVTQTRVLLPRGVSEHTYALRPSDIKHIRQADLVVWVGPQMENFMSKFMVWLPLEKKLALADIEKVQSVLIPIKKNDNNKNEETNVKCNDQNKFNMHIWLSPKIAMLSATAIHQRLVSILPKSRKKLDANLAAFKSALNKKNKQLIDILLPFRGKRYYVFHDAYPYYEKNYGLKSLGHFTINPEIQPGARSLYKIRTQLLKRKVQCIFSEPQFRPTAIKAVTRGTHVRIGTLDPLGTMIPLDKNSYINFLTQLSDQYTSCLKED